MLKVHEFINQNGVKALNEELGIHVREYPEEGLMTLNYSQIDSPKHHEVVKECRALILENVAPYKVVSRAFDRFYNFGECQRSNLFNIDKYIGWEKLDGTIMSVYNHRDKWNVSTRKMAFAEGTNMQGFCFNDLFRGMFDFSLLENIDTALTLIFEMVSSNNRIVKKYDHDGVYLLGVRNKITGEEYNYKQLTRFAEEHGLVLPQMFSFSTNEEIFQSLREIDPFDEGYVFVDYKTMHRIKIKNPSYVAIAHLRDNGNISPKRLALLVMAQDHEEYLSVFPEDKEYFDPYIEAYDKMRSDITMAKDKYFGIVEQKEFALAIKDIPAKSILFGMRKGVTFEDMLNKATTDSKLNLLNGYIKNGFTIM